MNNEYWVKLTKRMNLEKYTKYYNKLLNIVLSEKFEWFKKIELNDIQVGNIYESKNLIPIGKIYVDSIWGYNQWKEYHYDSSFPTDEEVSFGDIIGGDLSKEIQEQFKLCFSQIIGSLKPKYMCFSWLEMVLVDEDDNTLQESIRRILREETKGYKIFNPRNPIYMEAWLNIGDEDIETYEEYGIDRIESIINEVKELEFPLRVYRGINVQDIKGKHNLINNPKYDNISWSTSRYVAEGFGNVVYTGIVESLDDINLEYTIYRRVLHKPLYENEIVMKDNELIKNLKRFR